jgi:cell division septation protein DedD
VKERLTGAIILVVLMVLVVPELLTGPIRSAPSVTAVAPSAEEPPVRSYTINLTDDAHRSDDGQARGSAPGTGAAEPPTPPAAGTAAVPPERATPIAASPPVAATAQPAAPHAAAAHHGAAPARSATAASPAPEGAAGAWVVQLGSFASRANAERLAQQLRTAGFKVNVSQASSGRRLYRVWAGPAHDRAGATALAGQLQAAGHSGAVVQK